MYHFIISSILDILSLLVEFVCTNNLVSTDGTFEVRVNMISNRDVKNKQRLHRVTTKSSSTSPFT